MEENKKNGSCKGDTAIVVRGYTSADNREVQRIFREGMMEMVFDTAFRGLMHHPESQLIYAALTVAVYASTGSLWLACGVMPLVLMARCYYSKKAVDGYLKNAWDMQDIAQHYLESLDCHLWLAEIRGSVVGMVSAHCLQDGTVELRRMSVDHRFRRHRVGAALGQKVIEFARLRSQVSSTGALSVILGTTAYNAAPHRLYLSLGFRCVGVTEGYSTPGTDQSLLEQAFYRVRHHHYRLDLQ